MTHLPLEVSNDDDVIEIGGDVRRPCLKTRQDNRPACAHPHVPEHTICGTHYSFFIMSN